MGIGLRIFLVNENDTLERLAVVKFERLGQGDPEVRLPQYAYKRVRYALVVLEIENRKAVGINMIQYSYLTFDPEGRLDTTDQEQAARLALDMLPPISSEESSRQVIDASHKFAKKRYDDHYTWKPTPEIEAAIVKTVLGTHHR